MSRRSSSSHRIESGVYDAAIAPRARLIANDPLRRTSPAARENTYRLDASDPHTPHATPATRLAGCTRDPGATGWTLHADLAPACGGVTSGLVDSSALR